MTRKEALTKWSTEVAAKSAEVDPDNERDWYDMAYGFFLALGFSVDKARDLAGEAENVTAIELHHLPWDGRGDSAPFTWDYAKRFRRKLPWDRDMAMTTCGNGHTYRMVSDIHTVAADGTVTPSYVCPHSGCDWHVWVRLVDWDPAHVFEYLENPTEE